MAGLKDEFAKRNTKIIGLSVDAIDDHQGWLPDIEEVSGNKVDFPMIGDHDLNVAKLYNMLPADAGDTAEGRTAANNATVRTVYIIGPDKKIQRDAALPDEQRAATSTRCCACSIRSSSPKARGRDAGQLEAGRGCASSRRRSATRPPGRNFRAAGRR